MYISDKGILYVTNWLVYMHLHVQPYVQYCLVGCCLVTKRLIYPVVVSIGRGNGAGVATTARYVVAHFLWSTRSVLQYIVHANNSKMRFKCMFAMYMPMCILYKCKLFIDLYHD